jgi:MFS family permease
MQWRLASDGTGGRGGLTPPAFALAVAMMGTTLPTPLYVLYREQFGFSELMITVIFATYAAGVIASLLLFGRLSDQIGRRWVLLPGLALSALSAAAFLLADGLPLLIPAGSSRASLRESSPARRPPRWWISPRLSGGRGPRSWRRSRTWARWGSACCWRGCSRSGPARRCG